MDTTRLREVLWRWRVELLLFAGTLAVYCAFAGPALFRQSAAPHFVYQAMAFLQGQLHLAVDPPNQEDWARVGNHFYVSFPPFPAVVMIPFVLLHGYQFIDTFFTVVFGALNVVLVYRVLLRFSHAGDTPRSDLECLALAALFGFGTLHFYMSLRGEVWFTAQVMGVTLACLYLLAAHRARHPVLAGLALGLAAVTRTPLAFAFVYFVFELLLPDGRLRPNLWRGRSGELLKRSVGFALPILVIAGVMMWMNVARFDDPFEFGHRHLWNNRVNAQIREHGLFDLHYLERNLRAAFIALPVWQDRPAGLTFDGHGMSVFLTTPLFFLLLWPKQRPRLHRALWVTVAVVALPGLLYQNDGYFQFGYRFSLDWTPFLFLLLAMGGRPMKSRTFLLLAAASVGMGIWGAAAFKSGWWPG